MPMGCAVCGHAPYAHGCPDRPADHEYAQPSGDLLDIRLRVRRTGDRSLPCFEPPAHAAPARTIPAQRSAEVVAPISVRQRAGSAPAERIPPIPAQRRPERRPAVESPVPVSPPRRMSCRPRPASAPTRPSRLGCGRRLVPRSGRRTTCAPNRSAVTPSSYRPPGRYGEPLQILPRFMKQARPTLTTTGRALDRIEVQPVRDGSSAHPEPTSPETTIPKTTIPGWRLILSDAGRLWASRERPFSKVATHAGAERTVDGDSLEALRAETDRQETFAREAEEQAAREQETRETPASEEPEQETREQETREQETREREMPEREQAGRVVS